jgi:hypothetical protein
MGDGIHKTALSAFGTSTKAEFTSPFRITILLVASLVVCESAWLLVPEFFGAGIEHLPIDKAAAAAAADKRAIAAFAASVGDVRGDLSAQSAYTFADLWWSGPGATVSEKTLEQARASVDRALDESPHRSDVWLLLAALAQRYGLKGIDPVQALKMSYYTGPSERDLIPLRIAIAAQSDFVSDVEMREFVSRDLRLLATEKQNSAIAAAYGTASSGGKHFIEQTLAEISPPTLQWLRSAIQSSQLPD